MRLTEILKSSFATLRLNIRRTFLTMIGIIIGIAAVITIMSLGNGFQKQTLEELAQDEQGRASQAFYYNPTNFEIDYDKLEPFAASDLAAIEMIPGVDEVKKADDMLQHSTYMSVSFRNVNTSYEISLVDQSNYEMLIGRNLSIADSQYRQKFVIIDLIAATELFGSIDNALHKVIELDNTEYTIVGVYDNMSLTDLDDSSMLGGMGGMYNMMTQLEIPQGTFQHFNPQTFYNWEITVFYEPDVNMKVISQQILDYLTASGSAKDDGAYTYFDSSEMMEQIGSTLNMITLFISAVASISLFIAGVGVMNMMYISVSERTKEIGIRRSLGATRRSIQWQFLLEGIAITTLGGLVGYFAGIGIAFGVSRFLPFSAIVDFETALVSVSVSIIIGLVFSVFPARAAAQKNVVEILR